MSTDNYKTISRPSEEILFKEKKSKFYGYAFPIASESDVKSIVDSLKRKYPSANHVCFAWRTGVDQVLYRTNDDGEPNNSAGMPIYGQIQSFEVTDILVAVVRIFGGTKLGVGGLISAYRAAARMALESASFEERILSRQLELIFDYAQMDVVMRYIKRHRLNLVSQQLDLDCRLRIEIPKSEIETFTSLFKGILGVQVKEVTGA